MEYNYSQKLWKEIKRKYSKRNRHYHNLSHILDLIENHYYVHIHRIKKKDEILFAIFYHDIIYNTLSKTNEIDSALLMYHRLNNIIEDSSLYFIHDAITFTKTHEKSDDFDIDIFLDFDMYIIASKPNVYKLYLENIRKEYWIYPSFMYKKGRLKFLKYLDLNIDNIFITDIYKKNIKKAKNNIKMEMKMIDV